jgi:hypothetical protein
LTQQLDRFDFGVMQTRRPPIASSTIELHQMTPITGLALALSVHFLGDPLRLKRPSNHEIEKVNEIPAG